MTAKVAIFIHIFQINFCFLLFFSVYRYFKLSFFGCLKKNQQFWGMFLEITYLWRK